MKVLVTGATGFIGRHLVPRLLSGGHSVHAVARDEGKGRNFDWFGKVRFSACDIQQHVPDPLLRFGEPDAVVHLAWQGLPNYRHWSHFERNLPADFRFLKGLIEGGMKHLLVTGTCLEYGMQCGCLSEDLATAPGNAYALAKDTLRRSLELLTAQTQTVVQWARLFYMYGPGQNPNSLLSQLDRAIDAREPVFNMSGGEQLRDYLPVGEVAARLAELISHPECSGIVNICSGKPISVRRLVELHLAKRGTDIGLNLGYFPYPDYEPMAFWGDTRKYDQYCRPAGGQDS